jgi:indole-3-glycerol phosphate synthase
MSGFLDAMARSSRERVAGAAAREPLARLRTRAFDVPPAPPLVQSVSFGLIAEYKRRSPSQREPTVNGSLAKQVTAYAGAGAAAVSVLTEPTEFHGSLADAGEAARSLAPLGIPVLRKDFLIDPYQLYETRALGCAGALLIARMLSDAQLREMLDCCRQLGLFVLLETFDAMDIERAAREVAVGVPERSIRISRSEGTPPPDPPRGAHVLFGVNCRDLQTLEVMPQRFHELAPLLPEHLLRVAESGIATPDDCADLARNGYGLGLVGSALMSAPDPAAVIRTMLAAGRLAA